MSEHLQKIRSLAVTSLDEWLKDVKDLVQDKDMPLVKELAREIAEIEIEAVLADDSETRALVAELSKTKRGTMLHLLDTQRIVASREMAALIVRSLKTFLTGFSVVTKEVLKAGIRVGVGGPAGALLGSAGEGLVESAIEAIEKASDSAVDKGVEKAKDALDDVADNV